jgi:hypothetical protein
MATPDARVGTLRGFVSYAHVDHAPFGALETYLTSIGRAYDVVFWADRRITAGNHWSDRVAREIEGSHIHLLLMSPAFFASDYIFEKELPAIAERCRAGALIVPILVKPCFWSPFVGVIQAVPMTLRGELLAITEWKPKHNGYNAAANQIADAIGEQFNRKPKAPFAWTAS